MDTKGRLRISVLALALIAVQSAHAQSLGDILKQVVVDSAKEVLSGQATIPSTRGTKSKPDYMRDSWNNASYNPLERNGYTLARFGMSDLGKFGNGVNGRSTCDDRYLAHALTKQPYAEGHLDRCVAIETQLQQRGREYDGAARRDFPVPSAVPGFREKAFATGLPKKLFVRTSNTQFLHVTRRPKGLLVDVAGLGSSSFLAGYIEGVQYTLKGPQVVTSWLDYTFPREPQPNSSPYGLIRFFLPATPAEMDKLFGTGSMTDQRMSGLDTIYYQIHKVRDVGRTPVGDRLVEVTLTIDRLEIGMDKTLVDPKTYTPREKLVWTNGMSVKE